MEQFGTYRLHVDDADRRAVRRTGRSSVDNYLEGYHVPVAHPGLMRLLDYKRYNVDDLRHLRRVRGAAARQAVGQLGRADVPAARAADARPAAKEDERVFRYVAIYPNTVIDLYPDHVLIWKMNPAGVDRTGVPGTYLRRKNCDLRTRAAQWLNLYISQITTHEDEDLVGRMQRRPGQQRVHPRPALPPREGRGLVRRPDPGRPRRAGRVTHDER